jgi:hypothetical protein
MSYFSQLGLGSSGTGYVGGWRNGDVAEGGEVDYQPAPPLPPLQDAIDYAAELAEYREWIADQDYHRSGNW